MEQILLSDCSEIKVNNLQTPRLTYLSTVGTVFSWVGAPQNKLIFLPN